MQTNFPLQEPSSDERLDVFTSRFAGDAVIAGDSQQNMAILVERDERKTSPLNLQSSKRILETDLKAPAPSPFSKNESVIHAPSLESLTYKALLHSETGRVMSSSMPALGYVHDEEYIANILQQVPQTDDTSDSNVDTLQNEEAAAAYGYGDEDNSVGRSFPSLTDEAASPVSPIKRRRVMRRNSFVIPRGTSLVAGLIDLQDAGKFHFGANDPTETEK
jgi:hypothetical protein